MVSTSCCVIVPIYNHASTVGRVIHDILSQGFPIIVVNDGSTDDLASVLEVYEGQIKVISYEQNRGKGFALRTGFEFAKREGFLHAITIDADGQHYPSDLYLFQSAIERYPDSLILGVRNFSSHGIPRRNLLGNKISNFWFRVQTGNVLPDTQSGFRAYPLTKMEIKTIWSERYGAELEMLVRHIWNGGSIVPVEINVSYSTEKVQASHFHPFSDFIRISVLNTILTFSAFLYGYPRMLFRRMKQKVQK